MKDWFFYQEKGKTVGPVTEEDLRGRIREGRIRLFDLIHKEGDPGWRMAMEYPDLKPEFKSTNGLKERPWVCLQRKTAEDFEFVTTGPFSQEEIRENLLAGRMAYTDYAWKTGFKEWQRIGSLEEFNPRVKKDLSADQLKQSIQKALVEETPSLQNVVELRRSRVPQPELPPEEADGADLTKAPEAPPRLPPTPEIPAAERAQPVKSKKSNKASPPIPKEPAAPDSTRRKSERSEKSERAEKSERTESRTSTTKDSRSTPDDYAAAAQARSDRRRSKRRRKTVPWFDWGIVVALVLVLGVVAFVLSRSIRSSQRANPVIAMNETAAPQPTPKVESKKAEVRFEPPQPEAELAPPEAEAAVTEAPARSFAPEDDEPAPPPVPATKKPTELYLAVQSSGVNQVRIEVRSNGSPDIPIYVQVVGLPGQVSDGPAFYRYMKMKATATGKPLDLSALKLPQGKFILRVASGDLQKETRFGLGLTDSGYKQSVARMRKAHAASIWNERLQLFRLVSLMEKRAVEANAGKKFNAKGLEAIDKVKRSNGQSYLMFETWYELKDILQESRTQPSVAVTARIKKMKDQLASFSVWK